MLSQKLHAAINEQINAELWSAYLYLSMSLDAEAKGYKGVANWFYVQWLEEQDHARILQNYLKTLVCTRKPVFLLVDDSLSTSTFQLYITQQIF